MSWSNEDGLHEGYAASITMDGREAVSSSLAGMHMDTSDTEVVPYDQLLGWEAHCECGWMGPMYRRVGADEQDAEEHRLLDSLYGTASDAIHAAWLAHVSFHQAEEMAPHAGPGGPSSVTSPGPDDVAQLTDLLDLIASFESNEQRARFLLSSNWMRDRGAAAGAHVARIRSGEPS